MKYDVKECPLLNWGGGLSLFKIYGCTPPSRPAGRRPVVRPPDSRRPLAATGCRRPPLAAAGPPTELRGGSLKGPWWLQAQTLKDPANPGAVFPGSFWSGLGGPRRSRAATEHPSRRAQVRLGSTWDFPKPPKSTSGRPRSHTNLPRSQKYKQHIF